MAQVFEFILPVLLVLQFVIVLTFFIVTTGECEKSPHLCPVVAEKTWQDVPNIQIKLNLQISDKSCNSTTGFGEDASLIFSIPKGSEDSRAQGFKEILCKAFALDP